MKICWLMEGENKVKRSIDGWMDCKWEIELEDGGKSRPMEVQYGRRI